MQLNFSSSCKSLPVNRLMSSIFLVWGLRRQWASPLRLSAAQNSRSLPVCCRWTMEEGSGRVQSSQSIWLSRQALFLLKTTRRALVSSWQRRNWSWRSRFSRKYLLRSWKPSRVSSTIRITFGARNTMRYPSKTSTLRCLKLLGLRSSSSTLMCDPSLFIEKLFSADSPTRVGRKSSNGQFASSSGSALKHFWKGMCTLLAWFTQAVMRSFSVVSIWRTACEWQRAMRANSSGRKIDGCMTFQITIIIQQEQNPKPPLKRSQNSAKGDLLGEASLCAAGGRILGIEGVVGLCALT